MATLRCAAFAMTDRSGVCLLAIESHTYIVFILDKKQE